MSLRRNVSLEAGLRYQGGIPYLSFILHRIGGSALFIFFTLYIFSLLGWSFATVIFSHWIVQIILVVFGLFHAINGLRITLLDLFPNWMEHYQTVIRIEWVTFVLAAGFALFVVLRNALGG